MNHWKKQAAQVLGADDVEKAFLDQSYTFVSNKVKGLMNAPHSLGFEVIHKNDSNTRMVAIFAFKASDQLLYVPVFFLNGEIKGHDLMYQVQRKAMVPSEIWAEYYIQLTASEEGEGMDRSESRRQDRGIDLEKINSPNGRTKSASLLEELSEQTQHKPMLREFLEQESPDFIEKLAKCVEDDFDFANDIYKTYTDLSEVIPPVKQVEKQASSIDGIEVFTGLDDNVKSAADNETIVRDIYTKGYHFKDLRKEGAQNVITEEGEIIMDTVGSPGYYNLTLPDGTQKKGICVECLNPSDYLSPDCGDSDRGTYLTQDSDIGTLPLLDVIYEDGTCVSRIKGPIGEWIEDLSKMDFEPAKDMPEKGSCYRILDTQTGKVGPAFTILKKSTKSGVCCLTISEDWGEPKEIRHNPDVADCDPDNDFYGSGAKFIKVKGTSDLVDVRSETRSLEIERGPLPATNKDIRRMANQTGVKQASVRFQDGFFEYRLPNTRWIGPFEKMGMELALASGFNLSLEDAGDVVKEATSRSVPYNFNIAPNFEKGASRVRLDDEPDFQESINRRFGIMEDPPQHFVVNTYRDREDFPEPRIGDRSDPGLGGGPQSPEAEHMEWLMKAPPEEIAQAAQTMSQPHMFDPGIVGSMVDTYDAISMVDKWLPKLEASLDATGRMVFLYYWKPGDFQEAYGVDDMEELENQLLSNFRSMGDLVMNLIKKSSKRENGPAPIQKSR